MRWSSLARLLPPALDAIMEGTAAAIVYLMVQVLMTAGPAPLGLVAFGAAAGAGVAVVRLARPGPRRTLALLACAVGMGAVGWLAAQEARSAVVAGDIGQALAAHPGGWLAGLAVLFGARHADRSSDDLVVARTLSWGLPGLAIPWLLAQAVDPLRRTAFVEPAFVATLTFVTSGLLAIAIVRLEALRTDSGPDWRSNGPWLAVLGGAVLLMLAIAIPLAFALGVPITAAIRGLAGPLLVALEGIVVVIAIPAGFLAGALAGVLRLVFTHGGVVTGDGQQPTPPVPPGSAVEGIPAPVAWLLVAAAAIAVMVVAWTVVRRIRSTARPTAPAVTSEERATVLPPNAVHLGRRVRLRLPTRPRAPTNAVQAYVALDRAWHDAVPLARSVAETPAQHSRRLRDLGHGSRPLERLSADYQLARYAGRTLSPAEERRAIRRLRQLLRWKPSAPEDAAGALDRSGGKR